MCRNHNADIGKDKGCGDRVRCQMEDSRVDQWKRWRVKGTECLRCRHEMTFSISKLIGSHS